MVRLRQLKGCSTSRGNPEKGGILASILSDLGHYQAKNGQKEAKIGHLQLLIS
jgi:hypothetical protein